MKAVKADIAEKTEMTEKPGILDSELVRNIKKSIPVLKLKINAGKKTADEKEDKKE